MPVKITNLTSKPVFLTLSSGNTVHLAPRTTSAELADVEIKNNPKIDKLSAKRIIHVDDGKTEDTSGTSTSTKKTSSRKKSDS